MTDKRKKEIRRRLDEDLSSEVLERDYRGIEEAATGFFQELFVELLNFNETPSPLGDATWQDLPVHEWPQSARAEGARLFAESGNFRIIYVELEKLTRTAERNAIQSLTRSDQTGGWAIDGSFLTVFHAPEDDIWHLVTPYEEGADDITVGRPVLRRYTLGEGETHRTVAGGLANMDASKGRLAERIDEAFRVKPVTEDFYENYKSAFDTLKSELRGNGLDIEAADRYAHVTLNRLMFFYYLQKKGWIGDRKDFVRWFHEQYEVSSHEDVFHQTWLSALFFDGVNQSEGGTIDADLPSDVELAVSELPYMNGGLFQPTGEDDADVFLSDSALESVIHGFLEQYNFTVTEESPYDINIAVDPAMLGKIYESLIAEQERGEAGIFYTPRVEVDLMCRISLYEQFCDHANDLDSDGRQRIAQFIFSEINDWSPSQTGETSSLESILHGLSIVDPACGSGAFLVGMKQVLTELYRKLGEVADYSLKEKIINENLYGVDIKDWAVRVAEFRLWLSLVEGEESVPEQRPVLPNFSFKLRSGDSIVQTVEGELLSFEGIRREATGEVYKKLQEVYELKQKYFSGDGELEAEVEQAQRELLITYLDSEIENIERSQSQQHTLSGATATSSTNNKSGDERAKKFRILKEDIQSADDDLFFWELDFPEVMLSGGFDVVIGNPPYVRHSEIIPQDINPDRIEEIDPEKTEEIKNEYKNNLLESVEETFDIKPYKRSDLYLYFYFKGMGLLREGGTLAFVTSNSFLDANYGRRLQEGFLRHSELKYILNNRRYRSFEEADVNTVITVLERATEERLDGQVAFTSIDVPYEEVATVEGMQSVLIPADEVKTVEFRGEVLRVATRERARQIWTDEVSLWRLGGGSVSELQGDNTPTPAGTYSDASWGKFVRAPDAYYKLLAEHGAKFKPLSELADHVRRGVTSGANDFFYIPLPGEKTKYFESKFDSSSGKLALSLRDQDTIKEFQSQGFEVSDPMFEIEHDYVMSPISEESKETNHSFTYVDSDGETWVPNYLVKSPKEIGGLSLSSGMVKHTILQADEIKSELAPGVREYIEWGEEWEPSRGNKYPERPTCSAHSPWYNITNIDSADVLFPERVWSAYVAPANKNAVYDNKNLYGVQTAIPEHLSIALNTATTWMFLEIGARSSLGEGVLDIDVNMAEDVLIPIPDDSREVDIEGVELQGDIFEQLGIGAGEVANLDQVSDDRQYIDDIGLNDWVGVNEDLRAEIYDALVTLVGDRIDRSRSV
jgi:hypothetical protein